MPSQTLVSRIAAAAVILAVLGIAIVAAGTTTTIDLDSTPADLTVYGDNHLDASGFAVAAGDIDGDGRDDLVIGAPFVDFDGRTDAGAAYVIFGRANLPGAIDLNTEQADIAAGGAAASDQTGATVAAGDLNGDGADDLIVGASLASPAGRFGAGVTYVVFGGAGLPPTFDLATDADVTVYGVDAGDLSASALTAGDINGDGIDDLVIGAWAAGPESRGSAGETYVLFGGDDLPALVDLSAGAADVTVVGGQPTDFSGSAVAVGDIDGDGIGDLVIGAYGAAPGGREAAGETAVVLGSASLPPTIDLAVTAPALVVAGNEPLDYSGAAVAAGDVNGDGADDLLIGAWGANPGGRIGAGEAYIVYGGGDAGIVDLSVSVPDVRIAGEHADDMLGAALALGDVNDDGLDDPIIGAYGADPGGRSLSGTTYVTYGASTLPGLIDLGVAPTSLAILGDDMNDSSGRAVGSGDINGDGVRDVIIGAREADPAGGSGAGETYVIAGSPSTAATATLSPTAPTPTETPTPSVAGGDVNCDSSVTSVDAALVLQFVARLLDALPCATAADTNQDGLTDARDGTLILQFVGGLLDTLPP